ncbi:hypothetical protein KXW88_001867, partial [Aspergillus fumigatus]
VGGGEFRGPECRMQLYSLRKIPPLRLAELGCHVRMNSNTERSKRRCNTTKMQCYAGNGKPTELNCVDSSAGSKLRSFLLRVILPKLEVKVIGVGFQSSAAASSPSFSISIVDSVASRAPEGTSPNSINGLNVLPVQKNRLTLSEQLETSTTSNHTEGEATSEATRIHPSVVDEIMFVEPYDRSKAMEDVFVEFRVLIDADGSLAVAGLKRHAFSKRLGMETPSLVAIISSTNLVVSGNSCDPTRENEQ